MVCWGVSLYFLLLTAEGQDIFLENSPEIYNPHFHNPKLANEIPEITIHKVCIGHPSEKHGESLLLSCSIIPFSNVYVLYIPSTCESS
jgi:hypothetical protein